MMKRIDFIQSKEHWILRKLRKKWRLEEENKYWTEHWESVRKSFSDYSHRFYDEDDWMYEDDDDWYSDYENIIDIEDMWDLYHPKNRAFYNPRSKKDDKERIGELKKT